MITVLRSQTDCKNKKIVLGVSQSSAQHSNNEIADIRTTSFSSDTIEYLLRVADFLCLCISEAFRVDFNAVHLLFPPFAFGMFSDVLLPHCDLSHFLFGRKLVLIYNHRQYNTAYTLSALRLEDCGCSSWTLQSTPGTRGASLL